MKWLKRKLLNYLTRNLLAVVDEDMVLTQVNSGDNTAYYLLGGEKIDTHLLTKLKQEASLLKEMEIWKIFDHTLRSQANKVMFTKSTSFEDMITGKAMIYNLDVQKKIVETLEKIRLQSK